jgi:hypothetical protein
MPKVIADIKELVNAIQKTNRFFLNQVQKQVNTSFTLRNWMIGYYLAKYEQNGKDRAEYGDLLFKKLSDKLKKTGIKGLSFTTLHLCKQLYFLYPTMGQLVHDTTQLIGFKQAKIAKIIQTPSEQSSSIPNTPVTLLLNRLSFSHFVELVKLDSPLKRAFYETESIKNNWSVRELQRAINNRNCGHSPQFLQKVYASTATNPLITAPSFTPSKTLDSELPC